jgi:ubiquinone/menaquinone biosynthesis C-methylase UbiE
MNTLAIGSVILAAVLLGIIAYWQLVVAEGAYLGRGVVRLLYDWFAPKYDAAKGFDPFTDAILLAEPVLRYCPNGEILDVATGTGRFPDALFFQARFTGRIIALDDSPRMLAVAREKLAPYAQRITFLHGNACAMNFESGRFDAAACLEAFEFMPDADAALRAMLHALKPGGLLLVSNRIGPDAWKMPGRTQPTARFVEKLVRLGCVDITVHAWLVDYDLITARHQPGVASSLSG